MFLKIEALAKNGINLEGRAEYDLGGYVTATLVVRTRGRTWKVALGWGEETEVASRWFSALP